SIERWIGRQDADDLRVCIINDDATVSFGRLASLCLDQRPHHIIVRQSILRDLLERQDDDALARSTAPGQTLHAVRNDELARDPGCLSINNRSDRHGYSSCATATTSHLLSVGLRMQPT